MLQVDYDIVEVEKKPVLAPPSKPAVCKATYYVKCLMLPLLYFEGFLDD